MFDNIDFQDLSKMMGSMSKAKEKAKELEKQSELKRFSGTSGGGLVRVILNGKFDVIDIEIDDSLLKDKRSLQVFLISAFNDAKNMVQNDTSTIASEVFNILNTK